MKRDLKMQKQPPPPFFVLRGHEGQVSALHFTSEIELYAYQPVLISGSDKGEIFIWNLKTNRTVHRWKGHNNKMVMFLHYHRTSLFSFGRDGYVNKWRYENDEWKSIETIYTNSTSVGFCSPVLLPLEDTAYLMYLNEDKHLLKVHDIQHNTQKDLKFKNEFGMCFCLKAFQLNGNILVLSGFENGAIKLWDCGTEKEMCRIKLHDDPVICLDFDPVHKSKGMSGSVGHLLETWTVTEDMQIVKVKTVAIKNRGVNSIKIRDDGKVVIAGGLDSSVRVFSWKTLQQLAVLKFHELTIQCLALCPVSIGEHKSVFATGSKDQNIALWNIY